MGLGFLPSIALVTKPTRLEGLVQVRQTKGVAGFMLKRSREFRRELRKTKRPGHATAGATLDAAEQEADLAQYEQEDRRYQATVEQLKRDLNLDYPLLEVDRDYLPNFDFGRCVAVVVVGPDGLVANAARYVGDLPIIGINPDASRYDGILVPFEARQARELVKRAIDDKAKTRSVTLAEAALSDGQRMLAFNDFLIGRRDHTSARYTLEVDGRCEPQSSSGLLVSTGAGSTGWMSSVFNMVHGFAEAMGGRFDERLTLRWEDRRLLWAVREPFASRHSQANLVAGCVSEKETLVVESLMPDGGAILADGVASDYLAFNSGTIATVGVAKQKAHLVIG